MISAPFCAFADATTNPQAQNAAPTIDMQIQSLKKLREQEKYQAREAARDADKYLSKDWTLYRRANLRQDYAEKRIKELDEQIEALEKQKANP